VYIFCFAEIFLFYSLTPRPCYKTSCTEKALFHHLIPFHIEIFLLDIEESFKKQTTLNCELPFVIRVYGPCRRRKEQRFLCLSSIIISYTLSLFSFSKLPFPVFQLSFPSFSVASLYLFIQAGWEEVRNGGWD
jgi:hypothetical protein